VLEWHQAPWHVCPVLFLISHTPAVQRYLQIEDHNHNLHKRPPLSAHLECNVLNLNKMLNEKHPETRKDYGLARDKHINIPEQILVSACITIHLC